MKRWRTVRTQTELDAALADGDYAEICGDGHFEVFGSASVSAFGSASVSAFGSATVRAFDSASVHAFDSASVSAFGSASVSAFGSATVRAFDSASVRASGSATVRASDYVSVHRLSKQARITGGVVIDLPDLSVAEIWLAYYGLEIKAGKVVLFKGVGDDWKSEHGTGYKPGTKPEAPDWNPTPVCGGGLHLSPRPFSTHAYCDPKRYVACTVAVADIVPILSGLTSDKVKVARVLKCVEVDIDEVPVKAKTVGS